MLPLLSHSGTKLFSLPPHLPLAILSAEPKMHSKKRSPHRTSHSTSISPIFPNPPGKRIMAAPQEEGWPLGLRPLNARVGFVRNRDLSGSVSFSTLLTGSSSCSTISSSDLDSASTGSFFHDKSITLGSLIGVSSILELSRRSARGRTAETSRDRKSYKHKPWLFSLCSKLTTDAVDGSNTPSLRHFLEAERRTASMYRRNQSPATIYGPTDFSPTLPAPDTNSLFVGGQVAPLGESCGRKSNNQLLDANEYGVPLLFSCLRGSLIK